MNRLSALSCAALARWGVALGLAHTIFAVLAHIQPNPRAQLYAEPQLFGLHGQAANTIASGVVHHAADARPLTRIRTLPQPNDLGAAQTVAELGQIALDTPELARPQRTSGPQVCGAEQCLPEGWGRLQACT